jgi:TatD DNase family protein
MIDVHCHLTKFAEEGIETAKDLDAVITSALGIDDADEAMMLREKYPDMVYVSAGLHPTHIGISDKELETYFDFIARNRDKIKAIGEIGLDYHYIKDRSKIKRMKDIFIEFLLIAKELELPVVLHLRDAFDDGFRIIVDKDIENAVFHCYTGKRGLAEGIVDEGYFISIAPNIIRNKNVKQVAKSIALEKLLTETDSPYLAIEKGKPSTPKDVNVVAGKIAELKKTAVEEVDKITSRNARNVFKLF